MHVDHINGDGLDNTRNNLRAVTPAENLRNQRLRKDNTSGFKGVSRHEGRWRARVRVDGKYTHVGLFDSAEDAARAYDEAARNMHGIFARTNEELNDGSP